MGFFDRVTFANQVLGDSFTDPAPGVLIASDTNYNMGFTNVWWDGGVTALQRNQAMTVPAVARARNIICGTVGSLPLERYNTATDAMLPAMPLATQPDPASPRSVTYAWIADSMLFYGFAYVQVLETYQEDQRPSRWRWVDPMRVSAVYSADNSLIVGYTLDGKRVPEFGPGSIIAFPGPDEGLLKRAARTIRTAIELEEAAYRAAQEPTPQTILKSTGVDLPASKVTELLTTWKAARRERATAYLYNGVDMTSVGFSPEQQQLVAARQFHASEIARAVGIPAWYLNAESASATYTNAEQERRSLIDFSLKPILDAIAGRMSMNDITGRGTEMRWDLDDFLRGSTKERVDIGIALYQAGVATLDETRSFLDIKLEGDTSEIDL